MRGEYSVGNFSSSLGWDYHQSVPAGEQARAAELETSGAWLKGTAPRLDGPRVGYSFCPWHAILKSRYTAWWRSKPSSRILTTKALKPLEYWFRPTCGGPAPRLHQSGDRGSTTRPQIPRCCIAFLAMRMAGDGRLALTSSEGRLAMLGNIKLVGRSDQAAVPSGLGLLELPSNRNTAQAPSP